MTVIRSLTFCGTLFSILVILVALSSQFDFVLGQDESAISETDSDAAPGPTLVLSTSVGSQQEENEVIDHGIEADEHCPCVEEKSCPRKYGSDPLDFTTFGHLDACSGVGFVRCCGVSVSVVQQTDETVGGGVATASDIDEYDETATWDLGHAAEQQQEHDSEHTSNSKDNSEVSSDNLHEIHQGQLGEDTEKEEVEEKHSSSSDDEESKKENDEQQEEQIIDDNEDDDNVPAESSLNVQTVMMDESSPLKQRFQPASYKFPRYGGRPAAENVQENVVPSYDSSSSSSSPPPPPMNSGGIEDNSSNVSSGNNFRRKTFPSLRAQKVNPTPTSTPDNNGSGGSVVYSQRVSDFSPYRSRNNVNRNNNKASVVTATTVDGGSDIAEENVEATPISAEASSSLANGGNPARQRHPQRKRRPFNQMRNRQQQQDEQAEITDSKSLVMDGEEIGVEIKPEQPIYGTSGSGQSSPAPLHVPVEQEESPVVEETLSAAVDDQLDNDRRRPMSRLVKPRVNGPNNHGRRRMKPAMSDANGDSSLHPNNSYGSAPTTHPTDNGNEQQQKQEVSSSQEEESSGSLISNDSSADSKATIGSAAAAESGKIGGKVIQNSPTGKLMPLRPKIRPLFNRKAPGWSAPSNDNADGEKSQVNDDESKEVDLSGNSSSSGDLIKHTEQQQHQQPNNGAVNIRRIPMRRVQQQQQQQPENVPEENEGGTVDGNDGGNVEPEVPVATVPVVKGRISMRRPINYPGKNNIDVPATAPVQQLSTSIQTEAEPNVQPEQVVEKLDVRTRLRGRIRPNPLKASSSVQALPIAGTESPEEESSNGKADANSGEVVSQPQPDEPNRSPLLRKRRPLKSRPSILPEQGQQKQQAEEESANYSNNAPAVDASPVTNNVEDHQSGERPRVNIIRKGGPLARLPLQRNHNKVSQLPENTKEDDATLPSPVLQEATAKPTLPRIRQRQRISSNNRGNSRLPAGGNGGSVDETSASVEVEDANIATSEAPVTVTSTYSRIRTNNNNKNSLLTRPIYRRPSYTTTPPPSVPAEQYSSPQSSSTNAIGSASRFGQRTRFTVPSKSESQAAEQPTLSINSDNDNESEKQGQSSGQLNEQSNNSSPAQTSYSEDNNSGGRKKVGFVRRKMVRVRPKQAEEQQQTEQQILGENQEKKPEEAVVVYDQAGSNPGAPDTVHISIQEEANGLNKLQEEQQQQTPSTLPGSEDSVDDDDNGNDHVKIVSVASAGEDAAENTSHSEKEASGDDDKQGSVDEQDDDDEDDDDHTENSSEEADGKYYHNNNAGDAHHAGVSGLVDSDTYDLILNQDVRKTLGTQNATQHHTQYEEPSSAYQSPHPPPSPATHLANHRGVAGNSNVRNNNYQQQHQQQEGYGSNYDTYNTNTRGVNDHKYSAGVSGGSASSLASNHYNEESSAADGIETLELGTPDYDPNPGVDSSQYWQGYEDEEESRVHMKYLRNKSTPLSSSSSSSSSSPQSIESGEEHSLSQNESSNNYNGDNINGVGISQSPVNPQQQTPFSNAVPIQQQQQSQLSSSTNTDADSDAKREKNIRIRQKLRRPPSAYIGGSEDSSANDHVRAPTSAPFTPSLKSPRPTYSGQEALLESVHQSVQTLPPKQENPNSQQLEQFIEQNNKNVAPSRNRSRVRVKLVTLKTTTPAPVLNTNYDDDNENYSGTTIDATASSSNNRPSRLPSSKFVFPPFKKSELPLVDATAPVETESVSYKPQRVVFRPAASPSTTTTTTTTTTPAPRKPLRNSNYQNNDYGSNYNGINKGSISSSLPVKSRFKVNPSSTESIKQTASPSSYTSPAPVIKKTQPRIRAPQFHRRLPVITRTTETPVVIRHQYQVTSTSAPLVYSSNSENQPQQQQQPEPYHHTTSQLSEDDDNIISIRIASQDESSVIDNSIPPPTNENIAVEPQQYYQNFDTRHQQQQQQQQQQYLYQEENIVKEKPQLPPPPPPPSASTPLIYNDATKFNGKKNSGGKHSGRFKVPEKFELQKPHLLPSLNNNVDSEDVRKPYVKPALAAPVSLPVKQQDHFQVQIEPESNGHNLYDNVDVAYHHQQQTSFPQLGQFNNQVILEEQRRPAPPPPPPQQAEELEIVPDIRITIASPDEHQSYNVDKNEQNYNSNNNNAFFNREPEEQLIHAVREPQQHEQLSYQQQQQYYRPEQFERDQFNHNQALRNSQYGPFPSTDHWSGIPSSNSPKLPEHFEQNRLQAQRPQPSFEFQNEIRRPPISHEFEQQRPSRPMMLPPPPPQQQASGNDIRFVESDDEDNLVQYAPVPVNPTVIQFGSDFGPEEVEEEVISKPQRPALPFDHSGSHGLRENEGLSQQRPPISHPNRLPPLPPPPPPSYSHGIPPNENLEYQQRPVGNQEIQFSNNHISPVRSQNEQPQQQFINIHRQPPAPVQLQEPLIQGIPPNSVVVPPPVNPISIEIKDGELVNAQNVNDDSANNIPHPPPQHQQHMIQFPPPQQQQQQQIIQLPPPQQQQQQHIIQLPLVPPQQLHPQQLIHHQNVNMSPPPPGMVIEQNFRPDQRLPIQNSQLPPEHNPNFIVQVDGRPLDTNHAINLPPVQLLKPLDHPQEKEPEIKILNHPGQLLPPQQPSHPNFPTLNPEGRPMIMPNIRDQQFLPNVGQQHPQPRPQQAPLQHQQPPTQGAPNFGEALMQQGFGEHHPSRPGQYGPPPPGQQRPSQYIPFNAPPKRNESQELSHQQRLPVLPPPPQTFQNPFKFNGGQNQPFPPPQQQQHHASRPPLPYRQNFNGNHMSPIPQNQQFNNHHQQRPQQPPPVMMRMPNGIPNGQLGNNPHFPPQQNHHLRPRNSGMRTSRAANLTAEEEKDEREASGRFDISKQAADEHEQQSQTTLDQQEPAILQVPTPQNNIPSDAISQVAPNPESDKQEEGVSSSTNEIELPKIVPEAVGQQRQQRELVLNEQQKEDAGMSPKSTPLRAGMINSENFAQDELPDESSEPAVERIASQESPKYSAIPSSPLVEEKEQSREDDDEYDGKVGDNLDNLVRSKLGKQRKMQEQSAERQHKGKPEMEDGRLVQKSSSESKKSIMKIKSNGKDKSEQLGKGTANKNGKEQQASDGNAGDAEIQDFVAPKVIQRGFHPILPYSEQDPGPVVVQMLPKVEKFFPQPTMTGFSSDFSGRAENGPQGVMMMGSGSFHQDPNLLRNNKHASTGNLPVVVMMPTNVLNAQPTVVVNNQAAFRSLLHNHLS